MKNAGYPSEKMAELYAAGKSTPEIAEIVGCSRATAWRHVAKLVTVRSQSEATSLAISQGKAAAKLRGRPSAMSPDGEKRFRDAARAARQRNARGWRVTSQGYIAYTTGENAGRLVHRVKVEARLGRPLRQDEVVHHLDGDRANNDDSNLIVMSPSDHARLHRVAEPPRPRNQLGKFSQRKEMS